MDKLKFIITSIIRFIVILLLQLNIFNNLSIMGIVPDLFIIYCVYNCIISEDDKLSIIIAIITGFVYDIAIGSLIGIHALVGFIITLVTPVFCTRLAIDTKIGMMLYNFMVTFFSQILYGTMLILLNKSNFVINRFILIVLICSLYNFILTLIVHSILNKYLKPKDDMYKIVRRY